jgi:hypothetical protein
MLRARLQGGQRNLAEARERPAAHPTQVVRDLHQAHGQHLELPRQFDRGVLTGKRFKEIAAGLEGELCLCRQMPREYGAEFRPGVDAGADGGAALRQGSQARQHRLQARPAGIHLRRPAAELLADGERHRVHQMRAAGLDHPAAEFGARVCAAYRANERPAGSKRSSSSSAAATWIAVGTTSLLLWPMFTWSFACTRCSQGPRRQASQ